MYINNVILSRDIWLILSNLSYLLPAVYLFITQFYLESFTFFNITFISAIYHACYDVNYCIVNDKDVLQFMDFFGSYVCVSMIVIHYADIHPKKIRVMVQCLFIMILAFVAFQWRWETLYYIIPMIALVPISIYSFILNSCKRFKELGCCKSVFNSICCNNKIIDFVFDLKKSPFYFIDIIIFIIGCITFVMAYLCQYYSYANYAVLHSIWHALGGVASLLLFMPYNNPIEIYYNIKRIIKKIIDKISECFKSKNEEVKIDKLEEIKVFGQ